MSVVVSTLPAPPQAVYTRVVGRSCEHVAGGAVRCTWHVLDTEAGAPVPTVAFETQPAMDSTRCGIVCIDEALTEARRALRSLPGDPGLTQLIARLEQAAANP